MLYKDDFNGTFVLNAYTLKTLKNKFLEFEALTAWTGSSSP